MKKEYKYLIKPLFYIFEVALVLLFHKYIMKNHLQDFVSYKQPTNIFEGLFAFYFTPISLILRTFLQNFKIASTLIFILQNIVIFNVMLLDKVYLQNDIINISLFGVILNILFCLIDYLCIRSIDKMFSFCGT